MRKRLIWSCLIILLLGIEGFQFWQIHTLKNRISDAEWDNACSDANQADAITPDVGTIQFLKHGYSIELEVAKYTTDGLVLKGYVGNPTLLSLGNLTLKFSATQPLYKYRDQFRKNKFSFIFGPQPIGEAQTSPIASLSPGERQQFEVTIPNVKQTSEGVRIEVSFTGERYSYLLNK